MYEMIHQLKNFLKKVAQMHPALGIGTGKLGTKCGACEPLQSPTDVALEMSGSAELCRERPNLNSRNKYYDDSHTTDKDARHPEELALRREKRRVAPPNSLHQRVRIALCFALCAGCKLRKHKAIQAVNFPVLLVISGEL